MNTIKADSFFLWIFSLSWFKNKVSGLQRFLSFLEHDQRFSGSCLPGLFLFCRPYPVTVTLFVTFGQGIKKCFRRSICQEQMAELGRHAFNMNPFWQHIIRFNVCNQKILSCYIQSIINQLQCIKFYQRISFYRKMNPTSGYRQNSYDLTTLFIHQGKIMVISGRAEMISVWIKAAPAASFTVSVDLVGTDSSRFCIGSKPSMYLFSKSNARPK